jgi:hypothetical protein
MNTEQIGLVVTTTPGMTKVKLSRLTRDGHRALVIRRGRSLT